jgi:hypothetical protein
MLKLLRRKHLAKWIWIVLAVLIVPAFIFWGFGSYIRGKKETPYAGRISGRTVEFIEYKDAFEAVRNQAIIQFGENLSEVQKFLNFETQAWDRLILLTEARRQKIKTADREIITVIQNLPAFQRKGRFDIPLYNQMLQYVFRTQPRIFEEQIRQNIMIAKLYETSTAGIVAGDEELAQEYRKANEDLSIDYIVAKPADFAKAINPSDDQIKEYFTKNALSFKQPLSFKVEHVSLTSDGKNDAQIKEKLQEAFSRLRRKQELEKVAKDLGLTATETPLFGETDPIPGIGWAPQVSSLLAKTQAGQLLPPIVIDNKYYLVRLKEKKEPSIPELEAVKDKVKEEFIKDQSRTLAKTKIQEAATRLRETKAAAGAIDFNEVARAAGLTTGTTGAFKYGSYIEGVGASDNLWLAAEPLQPGAFSEPVETPAAYYIVTLKSKTPIDENKFGQEKEEFRRKLLFQKKQLYFAGILEELRKKAQRF